MLKWAAFSELFERVTCKQRGPAIYTYESECGLRSQLLYHEGRYRYCVDEPNYSEHDLARVAKRLWKMMEEERSFTTVPRSFLRPRSIEEYLEAKLVTGLGKLYPLLLDPEVEDVALNRPNSHVFINYRRLGMWAETNVVVREPEATRLALTMSSLINRPLSIATPLAEGSSKLGLRLALTLGDSVSPGGTSFVIRKIPEKPYSLPELISRDFITVQQAAYLWFLLEKRGFIIIVGGMATGKTTLLQALLDMMPGYMRIITIEDIPEIKLTHPNWDSLALHKGYFIGGGSPRYTLFDISKYALRRRADFLVIGEVRGEEAKILFQAAITGHGSLCLPPNEKLVVLDSSGKIGRMSIRAIVNGLINSESLRVLSLTEGERLIWIEPSGWLITYSDRWVHLELERGKSLVLTPDHPVAVLEKGEVLYREARHVETGDPLLYVYEPMRAAALASKQGEAKLSVNRVRRKFIERAPSFAYDLTLKKGYHSMVHSSGIVSHNCSFHAENVDTAVTRLTSPPISVPRPSIRNVWAFVVLGFRNGARKVISIAEVDPRHGPLEIRELIYGREPFDEIVDESLRLRALASDLGLSREELIDELATRSELLGSLARKGVDSSELRRYIDSFYALRHTQDIVAHSRASLRAGDSNSSLDGV